ncbi:MAG: extracellular solute-binding protein [Treponema sp.]|jgi:ABC-type glycerol-3-phosphate transport system substrate-binding protein|nr:extracellular solute-binding protein [Treponema sp.]
MKRIVFVVGMVLMGSTLLFAGGEQAGSAASSGGLTVIKAWGLDKQYALDNRSIALSEWLSGSAPSRVFEKFTEEMAKIGVKIDYTLVMADQIATAFQTMLASGQINNYDWIAPINVDIKTRYNLINQKALYPLNQAIQQYSTGAAKEFFFNDPSGRQIAKLNTLTDGNFYWLTQHSVGGPEGSPVTSLIRKDWLDKLGLPVPATLDEFYNTLAAFQEKDVNGNGVKDEVANASLNGMSFVASWFGLPAAWGRGADESIVYPLDGKAVSVWYEPQIKEYFMYMNKLFKAGLLNISDEGGSNVSNVAIENRCSAYISYMGDTWTEPTVVTPPGAPKAYYVPFVIQAKPGIDPRIYDEGGVMQWLRSGMYSVPARTKNIEKIVEMIDFFETPEYNHLNELGIEGYTYKWLPDMTSQRLPVNNDNVGADQQLYWTGGLAGLWSGWQGIFPRVNKPDPAHTPTKEARRAASRRNFVEAGQALGYPEGFVGKYEMWVKFEDKAWKATALADGILAFPTVQESDRVNELTPDLNTYASELISALIMGEKSLDNWDSYIADLKRLGIDEVIGIYQARLDRMK